MLFRRWLSACLFACLMMVNLPAPLAEAGTFVMEAAEAVFDEVDLTRVDRWQAAAGERFQIIFPGSNSLEVTSDDTSVAAADDYRMKDGLARVAIQTFKAGTTTLRARGDAQSYALTLTVTPSTPAKRLIPLTTPAPLTCLTRIRSRAFAHCDIAALTLPPTVTSIADDALAGSQVHTIRAVQGSYAWEWAVKHGFVAEEAEVSIEDLLDKSQSKTYDGGDVIYQPDDSESMLEETKTGLQMFYNDYLIVYFRDDMSVDDVQRLLNVVDGRLVGYSRRMHRLEIKFSATNYEGINALADALMQQEGVLYAQYNVPAIDVFDAVIYPLDENPWNGETDRSNEASPFGADWWAETIRAYTAWTYNDLAGPVDVGVCDGRIDDGHRELSGRVALFSGASNAPDDHGTAVAGIIAAQNDDWGMRGIADRATILYESDAGPHTGETAQLVESGARVINYSLAAEYFESETAYKERRLSQSYIDAMIDLLFLKFDSTIQLLSEPQNLDQEYDMYVQGLINYVTDRKVLMLWTMINLLLSDNEEDHDFLLVESAGNGYDNSGPGYEATITRFLPVEPEIFVTGTKLEGTRKYLADRGITYQTILDRTLLVASVDMPNASGDYQLSDFSNYGGYVEIAAPGQVNSIYTLDVNDGMMTDFCGTSASAPMVTGAAALLKSMDDSLTMPRIKEILVRTATGRLAKGVNDYLVYPVLDVGAAVEAIASHVEVQLVDGRDRQIVNAKVKIKDKSGQYREVKYDRGEEVYYASALDYKALDYDDPQHDGPITIEISANAYKPKVETEELKDNTRYTYVLEPDGRCRGTVIDSETRLPLEGVAVTLTCAETGEVETVYTDADGKYSFTDLYIGGYSLTFEKDGYKKDSPTAFALDDYLFWKKTINVELLPDDPEIKTVIFDKNGGDTCTLGTEPVGSITVETGKTLWSMPTATRENYEFLEWNTESDGSGSVITDETEIMEDITVYAIWRPVTYKVTFDKNGGDSCITDYKRVEHGQRVGTLPTPRWEGHEFEEWNTMTNGSGRRLTEDTVITENITVYAIWRKQEIIELSDYLGGDLEAAANEIGGLRRYSREVYYEWSPIIYGDDAMELISNDIGIIRIFRESRYALFGLQVGMDASAVEPLLRWNTYYSDNWSNGDPGYTILFDDRDGMFCIRLNISIINNIITELRYDWGITDG